MPVKHQSLFDIQIPECDGDLLDIKDLHFSYPDGFQALQGVNLSLCEGEKVALVGPNGAGKSTLMLHLNGILGTDSPVTIAGMAVEKSNLPMIRALVGLVFQNPDDQLFSPTVFDDVAFGQLGVGDDDVAAVEGVDDGRLEVDQLDAAKDARLEFEVVAHLDLPAEEDGETAREVGGDLLEA